MHHKNLHSDRPSVVLHHFKFISTTTITKTRISYFRVLSVRGVATGLARVFCERNAENSQQKSVRCLDVNESFDCRLFLLDHRAQLVGGQVHAVEVCQANFALGFLDDELELSERVFVLIQVAERDLEHTSLETVRGDF